MEKLTVNDFKLGLRAVRLYEEIFNRNNLVADLIEAKNTWDIIAICKVGVKSRKDYEAFILTDEYDELIHIAGDIIEKLFEDQRPKKD